MQMTNFDAREFNLLWASSVDIITKKRNTGRGRRSTFSAKDVFFMVLTVTKNGGTWNFLGRMFHVKGPTFERLVLNFLECTTEDFFERWVTEFADKYTMAFCFKNNKQFQNYPHARYANDVTFQESNRPSGSIAEGKKYYSGKHKLYGFKVEVSVLSCGLAIGCTLHYPGSVSDIDIFYKNDYFHEICLNKSAEDAEIVDDGMLKNEFPQKWAVLLDKGYQGAKDLVRAIHPKKKPKNGFLTASEEAKNKEVASDRIIVENLFGRMHSLWTVVSNKYRWGEESYDNVFKFCLSMTNAHIRRHLLRADDIEFYRKCKNRKYSIGSEKLAKWKRIQQRYREKRKRRLAMTFKDTVDLSDDETQEP